MSSRNTTASIGLIAALLATISATHAGLPIEDDPYAPPGIGATGQFVTLASNDMPPQPRAYSLGKQIGTSGVTP